MRVAVTGATGFIGRYVVAELTSRGIHATTTRLDLSRSHPTSYELLGAPDVLIHLAWQGLPQYDSSHHFEQELPRQFAFLKGLVEQGLKNVLVTGTCFEYGMASGELSEEQETSPTNPYGLAKDSLRRQLQMLQKHHTFSLSWARLFYMYGVGQAPQSIYSQLLRAIQNKEPTFNMSGGAQLRDYLPVETVARELVSLALARQNLGVVNVCSGKPISVKDIVSKWTLEKGASIQLNLGHYPYSSHEPMEFWGNARKLRAVPR